jgi:hypothetical protein
MSMTRPAAAEKPTPKPKHPPLRFVLMPMTDEQTVQMYRNLIDAVTRKEAAQEAANAAD